MFGKPGLQTPFDVAVVPETDDRNSRNFGDRTQPHDQIHSGAIGKGNVADEQIKLAANGCFHGRADSMRDRDQMPTTSQQFLQRSAGVVMIINEQNLQSLCWRCSRLMRRATVQQCSEDRKTTPFATERDTS